ncbi:MAG: SURF1 family protein [Burkholderiaceae bacterium]
MNPSGHPPPDDSSDAAAGAARDMARPAVVPAWKRWLILLAALATAAATASLGLWQLSRAAQKRDINDRIEQQRQRPALDNRAYAELRNPLAEVHRPARLAGQWVPEHTVFLDNRSMQGRSGFHVLTPLALEAPASGLLWVQRGWAPRDLVQPDKLPPVDTPTGRVEVIGRLAATPSRMLELQSPSAAAPGKTADGSGSSPIRHNLDVESHARTHGLDVRSGVLLETGAASQGLRRDWPEIASGVDKHYGYAFQWFGLSALVVILYVWFQLIAPRRRRA